MPTTGERFSLDVHNAGALGAGVQWARERLVEFTDDFWRPRPQSDSHGLQSANVIRLNLQVNLLLESFLSLVFVYRTVYISAAFSRHNPFSKL